MWRYFRKRRALRAYRTTLFRELRRTYGRKLYYKPDEVTRCARDLRGRNDDFICFALGMFCEREAFDAYHAANGEACDYDAIRAEAFSGVPDALPSIGQPEVFANYAPSGHDHAADYAGHHDAPDTTHHDAPVHHHVGDSFDGGGHHGGGFDGGHGGGHGGGFDGGGHHH